MIMVPVLILQIFLLPLTASWLMNIWVDQRRTLALKDAASHLGSTLQQIYFSLNHTTVPAGKLTCSTGLPLLIEDQYYTGTAVLRSASSTETNSSKVLEITLTLATTKISVDSLTTLGPNIIWKDSTFVSNSPTAIVAAEKFPNGTINLSFED
jgi:hypothetical protein